MLPSLALKYARALFEVASESGTAERVISELGEFDRLLKQHDELRETLETPAIPFSDKRKVLERVAGAISLSKPVRNFILVVMERGRIDQFGRFVSAYRQVWDESRGVIRGEVFSTGQTAPSWREELELTLSNLTGSEVHLQYREDESLIGGIKLKLGSTVFDGSIRTQLDRIQKSLAG